MTVKQADRAPTNWQLQDAKARFSEVVKRAREQGPQHISVRGEPAVVVLSEEEFAKLTSARHTIVDHILNGEPWPDDLVEAINDRSRDPRAAAALTAWLETLRHDHRDRILPVSDLVALQWGRLAAERPRGMADGLIAATALVHQKIIVTRNTGDFADTRVPVIDPGGR